MRVIGTAGHVDHGKSALVHALTGIHPDRLKEEREREMTIDLGFAWFELPNDESVGVVDVPGHRDFIENMLAGVGGIDAVLFVVAADEGIMPQTREHLSILDLLQINTGVVALTKADLAESPDWLALVSDEITQLLKGTALADAPIVPVSARTGAGLDDLRRELQTCLASRSARPDLARPRLPIDRVFTIAGFGTVVTGTLLDGALNVGDEVMIVPGDRPARIRGLQTHKSKIDRAVPGSRVAVNLTGVQVAEALRGNVLCYPNTYRPTQLVDVQCRHLADTESPLKHNAEVKFFVGAAETIAAARVLGGDELAPGEIGWLQLALRDPIVAAKGDRFILRRPSPGATIGGGVVVDPHPARRYKRHDAGTLARLETNLRGTPDEIFLQALDALGPGPLADAVAKSGLDAATVSEAILILFGRGDLVNLDPGSASPPFAPNSLVASRVALHRLTQTTADLLAAHHKSQPLKLGLSREELKSRLKLTPKSFSAFIAWSAARGAVAEAGALLKLPAHEIRLTPEQQASVERLFTAYRRDPRNTPSLKDSAGIVGDDVLAVLIDRGDLVQVSPEVLFLRETYDQMVATVRAHLTAHHTITVAQVRDVFNTSRKYALALMEHLDTIGVTIRKGDERMLR
ncbi:MAG TPA: selenocysteine-specific translation elongation factor [Anaerolineales bacterium]|nr:selenocysteine-specific translation elongation factor [Anaerolineales bacterium]